MSSPKTEIEDFHAAIVSWMNGTCQNTDAAFHKLIGCRFGKFTLVVPGGKTLEGGDVLQMLRSSHGSNPDFGISITDVETIHEDSCAVMATYVEWQRNARQSTPPDNGRISTVVVTTQHGYPLDSLHVIRERRIVNKRCFYANRSTAIN